MLGAHSMRLAQVLLRMMVATMREVDTYAVGCWPQGYPDCGLPPSQSSPAEQASRQLTQRMHYSECCHDLGGSASHFMNMSTLRHVHEFHLPRCQSARRWACNRTVHVGTARWQTDRGALL